MPDWVEAAVAEYRKRLPRDFELDITEVPMMHRGKSVDIAKARAREGEACLKAVNPDDHLIALDVLGKTMSTEQMAERFRVLRDEGRNLAMLVGGPDGLSAQCLDAAHVKWSLSALTFSHPVVRVILAEQLYRIWSILAKHPYHRG